MPKPEGANGAVRASLRGLELRNGDVLLCAVSGGADSMALLRAAVAELPWRGIRVVAAHLDHGIREEAADDAALVAKYCAELRVALWLGHADVPALAARDRCGIETAARNARYAFLKEVAGKCGATVCATAHHCDDQAETVLSNLLRGSGTLGLAGIPKRRGIYARPLLGHRKSELMDYCKRNGVPWAHDVTNDVADNPRNALRHEILPLLEELRPGATRAIARAASACREDEEALATWANNELEKRLTQSGLMLNNFKSLPAAVQKRIFRIYLRWLGGSPEVAHYDALCDMARQERAGITLHMPGLKVRFVREGRRLLLRKLSEE